MSDSKNNRTEKEITANGISNMVENLIQTGIQAQIRAFDWKSQIEQGNLAKLASRSVFNVAYEAVRNRSTAAVTIEWISKYGDTPSFRLFAHQMAMLREDPCTLCPKNPDRCKGCEYDEDNDGQISKAVAELDNWRALNGCREPEITQNNWPTIRI